MELIPSGSAERYYFCYGDCSEIHITIKQARISKLYLFLYDEFKREYCSLEYSAPDYCNTITLIKRVNHITKFKKEFGINFREIYKEFEDCLLQYLPECAYEPYKKTFKEYCERFVMPKSL